MLSRRSGSPNMNFTSGSPSGYEHRGLRRAQGAALRVCDRVSKDADAPHISISVGIAVYPQDGKTIEALLSAADQSLYKMKGREAVALNF